jgi:alpha-tubulin suppressor-like RCC1 family protein
MDTSTPGCTADCEFVDVVAGATHSCALRENGTVWCWGGNIDGTLGDGVMRHMECGMPEGGDSPDCSPPVQVAVIDDATQISSRGGLENCAIRESGGAWCWGQQSVAPATGGEAPTRFRPEARIGLEAVETVSSGFSHTCGVAAGQAVCIGLNGSGQIGDGTRVDARVAYTLPMPTGVTAVEAGSSSDFTCAIAGGAAFCWGNNDEGQLGDDVDDHMGNCMGAVTMYDCSLEPVAAVMPEGVTFTQIEPGISHVCALGDDANAYCWGANQYGQLGLGNLTAVNIPTQVTDTGDVVEISVGGNTTCILRTSGAVSCAGDNQEGQIGDALMDHGGECGGAATGCCGPMGTDCSWDFATVDGLTDATAVGVGWRHACAVRTAGDVVCWGYNTKMQLGNGTRERSNTPVVVLGLGD